MLAKYTEVLKNIIDNEHAKPLIDKALSTYPLYTNEKAYDLIPTREELNTKLLNHYKYREIGFETVGRFLDELEITMCEIMPYYNERFKTVVTMAELPNPFDNVDVIETYDEERTNTTTGNASTTGNNTSTAKGTSTNNNEVITKDIGLVTTGVDEHNKTIHVDTPQSQLSITGKNIDSLTYAESGDWNAKDGTTTVENNSTNTSTAKGSTEDTNTATSESETTAESETSENGTTKHTYTKKGNQGVNTYAHDMNEFRTSIIDVVTEIITDKRIAELFMLVY